MELMQTLRKIRACEGDAAAQLLLEAFVAREVAAERERCVKLCELHSRLTWNDDRKAQSKLLAIEISRPNAI